MLQRQQPFERGHPANLLLVDRGLEEHPDNLRVEVDEREVADVGKHVRHRQHAAARRGEELVPRLRRRSVARQHTVHRIAQRMRQSLPRQARIKLPLQPALLNLEHRILAHLPKRVHNVRRPLLVRTELLCRSGVSLLAHHRLQEVHTLERCQQTTEPSRLSLPLIAADCDALHSLLDRFCLCVEYRSDVHVAEDRLELPRARRRKAL
mmetsp:Transcript_36389/g.74686  ORF Transcript_36389/g.74686 Transcript_36389/m.74686 type:complete len:208 (-) Transcript_36389:99-722(-)